MIRADLILVVQENKDGEDVEILNLHRNGQSVHGGTVSNTTVRNYLA